MRKCCLIALAIVTIGAGIAVAGLSPEKLAWRDGPAQYLLTSEEIAKWKTIQSDADADAFIALFWARRDPTPATPENEFKETFDARVRFADRYYSYGKTPGSLTPRGKAIVLLGAPYSVRREEEAIGPDIASVPVAPAPAGDQSTSAARKDTGTRPEVATPPGTGGGSTSTIETGSNAGRSPSDFTSADRQVRSETWVYEHDRTLAFSPQKTVTLVFVDQESIGEYRLGRSADTNPSAVYEAAVKAAIVSPGMVSAPENPGGAAATSRSIGRTVSSVTDGSLHSPALVSLVDRMRRATELPFKGAYLSWDEFVTSSGESFVPVQIYMTNLSALPAHPAAFFGTVFDRNGSKIASYERPVTIDISDSAFVAATSLHLPPGKYTGLFGVAVDDNPLAMVRTELDVKGAEQASSGVSRLILSDDIHPNGAPPHPTDPFTFSGSTVVVKGDHLFNQKNDLWFLVELRNPGLNQRGTPKIRVQIDVDGTSGNRPVQLTFPLQDIQVEPLPEVAGHYALGQSIPLAKIPAGDYKMKLRIVDVVRGSVYDLNDAFTVLPAPSIQF